VPLRPKSWRLLCYLIAQRERAVSKDELLSVVWAGLVVQEQAVFQSICEIRAATRPLDCIQTLRGRGYRWVAKGSDERNSPGRWRANRWLRAAAIVIAAACVGGSPGDHSHQPDRPLLVISAQTGSDAQLPITSVQQALPMLNVSKGAGPNTADYFLGYRINLDGELPTLSYRLSFRGHQARGVVVGHTAAAIQDLAAQLGPLLLARYRDDQVLAVLSRYRAAIQSADQGLANVALKQLDHVLLKLPDYAPALLLLAEIRLADGHVETARNLAQSVVESSAPEAQGRLRVQATLLLAEIAQHRSRWRELGRLAQSAQRQALELGDDLSYALAQERLAEVAWARGDAHRARSQLRLARSLYANFCPTGERRVSARLLVWNIGGNS